MPTTYGLKSSLDYANTELEALAAKFSCRAQSGSCVIGAGLTGQEQTLSNLAITLPGPPDRCIIDFDLFVEKVGSFHVSKLTRAHFRGSVQKAQDTPEIVWQNYTTGKDWASISWTVTGGVLTPKIVYGNAAITEGDLEFLVVVTIKGRGSFTTPQVLT